MKLKTSPATHTIDAAGKVLGRLASQIAPLLIGKTKAEYAPNKDTGVFVEVTNVDKIRVTGKKMEQKVYRYHTTHPRGLREKQLKTLWAAEGAGEALRHAVLGMLPKNKLRTDRMKRLIIK